MKRLKPYELRFHVNDVKYLLAIKQYGFELRKERVLEVFEGALALIDMDLDPTTFQVVEADPVILKTSLRIIKALPRSDRVKVSRRDTKSIILAIQPDASWADVLKVQKYIGVI